jgi:hypothetical protein
VREPEELWAVLPGELRAEIDELLVEDRFVQAVKALRDKSGLTPVPGINEGKGLIGFRTRSLHERGLLKPPPACTVAEMLTALAERELTPVAVEITWDGDSRGWVPAVCAVVARPGPDHPDFDLVCVGWFAPHLGRTRPVRDEAEEKGRELAHRLGVPFHFPWPDHPGFDQPHWWDRRGAELA